MKIGRLSLLNPAVKPAKQKDLDAEIDKVVAKIFLEDSQFVALEVANERAAIGAALKRLCDVEKCPLVLTLGGTGPAETDIMPDVTLDLVTRKLPGFGEVMRYYSYERFKVSVLSRAEAGVRGKSLVINLPARPKPVRFCLKLLQEGIAEALEQISGAKPGLRGDEIEVPIDKYLPFLKRLRPKPDPDGDKHPTFK
jgi:molybdopterin adenylyltransferase